MSTLRTKILRLLQTNGPMRASDIQKTLRAFGYDVMCELSYLKRDGLAERDERGYKWSAKEKAK